MGKNPFQFALSSGRKTECQQQTATLQTYLKLKTNQIELKSNHTKSHRTEQVTSALRCAVSLFNYKI